MPLSIRGGFEIAEVLSSVRSLAPGEACTLDVTLRNVTGESITACAVRFFERGSFGSGAVVSQFANARGEMRQVSWANGAEMHFLCSYTFTGDALPDSARYRYRLNASELALALEIETNITTALLSDGRDGYENLLGDQLVILARRHRPRLTGFEVVRTPNDEGIHLRFSCRFALGLGEDGEVHIDQEQLGEYTMALRCKQGTDAESFNEENSTIVLLNLNLGDLLDGVTDSLTAIDSTFSNGEDYCFQLVIGNGIELASGYATIARAFANAHLSGLPTGGVCFGGFSSATLNAPKLECHYPAHFYAGLTGEGFDYTSEEVQTNAHWVDGKPIYRRVFAGSLSKGQSKTLGTITNMDEPVNVWGFGRDATWIPINYYVGSSGYSLAMYLQTDGQIKIAAGGSRGYARLYVVAEYTKK